MLGHEPRAALSDGRDRGLGERLDLHEPLYGQHWLDDRAAAIAMPDRKRVRLDLLDQALALEVFDEPLAGLVAIEADVGTSLGGHFRVGVHHRDHRQAMALACQKVVRIVTRRDLHRPGSELTRHDRIGDDRDPPPERR